MAYIDFGGTPDPANMNLSGSQEAVVMRDGSVQKGQILELGHTNKADLSSPFLVVFRTENGEERRLPSNQVARVYFAGGQPSSASTGSVGTAVVTPASGYTVSAQQAWSQTGIVLNRGEVFTVNATGEISTGGGDNKSTPGGAAGRTDPGNPLPGVATGTLIGRIGNSAPFVIGTQTRVTAPAAGQLFLGINDTNFGDNQGAYQVEIQRTGRRTRSH